MINAMRDHSYPTNRTKAVICAKIGAFSCATELTDQHIAVAGMTVPRDEDTRWGRMIAYNKANQKLRIKRYQEIRNKWSVQTTALRRFDLEKECYRAWLEPSLFTCLTFMYTGPVQQQLIPEVVLLPRQISKTSPEQQFVPSKELTCLVKDKISAPSDDDLLAVLRDLGLLNVPEEEKVRNVAKMITEQVEGMLVTMAKRSTETEKQAQITIGRRFSREVCEDLIVRLGLDSYDPQPVFKLLYDELLEFLSAGQRIREWGCISVDEGEIRIQAVEGVFSPPDYSKIMNDDKWESI